MTLEYIADLHIHSRYSRATSKSSHLPGLAAWAAIKGIQVLGTGDFTHPAWFSYLVENLEEAEPGFFRLKPGAPCVPEVKLPDGVSPEAWQEHNIRFVLTSEISSIYKRDGRVRKVHNILFAPDFDSVRRLNATLAGIGNLEADGRPILGLDSRDLLEILLEKAPAGFLVPAHIWTPWFSIFGSKSGFDTIDECFGDLSSHVFALETGLSSDPDMNRLLSSLDRFSLISNSDCHSPQKLGREANIFNTGFDFYSMREAMRAPVDESGRQVFAATIEFYPEEGKYHCDGHRKCGICLEPAETWKVKGICPVCGRPLTVGVLNRVMELADRSAPAYPQGSPAVHSLVPLPEVLGELLGTGPASLKVMHAYARLLRHFGSEFNILLQAEIEELNREASPMLGEAVHRIRTGRVIRQPGYDGEFGVIRVFTDEERRNFGGQLNLFGVTAAAPRKKRVSGSAVRPVRVRRKKAAPGLKKNLNPEQRQVVASPAEYIIVKAGPGTGKTHTLVRRVIRMVTEEKTFCTVITFTNKAADELQQRLDQELGPAAPVFVATFHGYCLHWLRRDNPGLRVAGPEMRRWLLRSLYPGDTAGELKKREQDIAALLEKTPEQLSSCPAGLQPYFAALAEANLVDIDAVIPLAASLLRQRDQAAATMRRAAGALFIDEFQDLNGNQYDLVLLLAATSPVFAIGDPNQAIYGFRGSDPAWFYRFIEALHPEQHSLVRNYRSGPVLVKAAQEVIGADRGPDSLAGPLAGGEGQGDIFIHRSSSAVAEAVFIAGQVERLLGGTSHREIDKLTDRSDDAGLALGDIAVLYRTGRQAEVLAGVFAERGLPVQVVDIVPFYLSGPALVLYLWVLIAAERGDSTNLLALLGREKGIGRRSLGGLEPLLPVGCRDPLAALSGVKEKLPARLGAAVADFQALRTRLLKTAAETGIEPALRSIVLPRYQLDSAEGEVVRFLRLAVTFGSSLTSLADHLQHYKDSVVYDKRAEAVALMTLHASKGLEFPVVFLAGLEEGLLPFAQRQPLTAAEEQRHLEEERRLFYVGLTRAERMVFLSHAAGRRINGKTCSRQPSRFLREIPAALLRRAETGQANRRHARSKIQQLSLF